MQSLTYGAAGYARGAQSYNATRLSTTAELRLQAEGALTAGFVRCGCPKTGSHRSLSTEPRMAPRIALWVRSARTRARGASFTEDSIQKTAHRSDTEKERVHGPQRDLARRPTASQRAARARAVCSGREDGTASGRGLTRATRPEAAQRAQRRSRTPRASPRTRSSPPGPRAATKKRWPSHPPICYLPPAPI